MPPGSQSSGSSSSAQPMMGGDPSKLLRANPLLTWVARNQSRQTKPTP